MTSFTRGFILNLYATQFPIKGVCRRWQNHVWNYICCIRFQAKETFHEWYAFLLTSKLGRDRYDLLSILGVASPQLVVCNI